MTSAAIEKRVKVFWTDDEEVLIAMHIIEHFENKGLPVDEWLVTERLIAVAQLAVIDEDRFRINVRANKVAVIQQRVNAHIREFQKKRNDSILQLHQEYCQTHGMTPFEHIEKLLAANKVVTDQLNTLRDLAKGSGSAAPEAVRVLPEVPAPPATRVIREGVGTVKPKPKFFLGVTHLNSIQIAAINAYGDVAWMKAHDGPGETEIVARGRHCIVMPNRVGRGIAKAAHKVGCSYHEISGGASSIERLMREITEREQ